MHDAYVEVEILADEELNEKLVGMMSQLGFEGFWEEGRTLKCYIRRQRWVPEMLSELETLARTMARSSASAAPKLAVRTLVDQNWNEEWEKTIRPIHVTDRIVITPSWHTYIPIPDQIVLVIDPKMSFGTGYHETTRLVLRMMECYLKPGMKLLDVGTGTGVLAIAGIKLGARLSVGIDNDEWAYNNALENTRLNQVERQTRIAQGEISAIDDHEFDIIVANIQRNVIENLLSEIKSHLLEPGIAILSGVLLADREAMRESLKRSGFSIADELVENEWVAFAARMVPG